MQAKPDNSPPYHTEEKATARRLAGRPEGIRLHRLAAYANVIPAHRMTAQLRARRLGELLSETVRWKVSEDTVRFLRVSLYSELIVAAREAERRVT